MFHVRADRGSAMIIVVVLVVVLMGLGGAFLATTYMENQATIVSEREVDSNQASAAALDKARLLLYEVRASGGSWNDTLGSSYGYFQMSGYQCSGKTTTTTSTQGGTASPTYTQTSMSQDGVSYYERYVDSAYASSSDTRSGIEPGSFYGQNFIHGDAVYNVVVADDDDGDANPTEDSNDTVVVFTTVAAPANPPPGVARRVLGVTRAVVYFQPPNFSPVNAITVGGNLILGGNPTIQGTNGSVHANGDLQIQGSPSISVSGSAAEIVTVSGSPATPPGGWNSNAPKVALPKIDPSQYISKANYVLESDGKVYDNATNPRTLLATSSWNGFSWTSSAGWTKGGSSTPPAGAIYVNGSVKVTGGGSESSPWNTTLLVNGNIEMTGNPRITPFLPGVSLMALGDIKLRGNASAAPYVEGLIAAHEQIDIAGTPSFSGAVVAEDAVDTFSLVTTVNSVGSAGEEAFESIMGNFNLTYNGGMDTFLVAGGTSVKVRSWDNYR